MAADRGQGRSWIFRALNRKRSTRRNDVGYGHVSLWPLIGLLPGTYAVSRSRQMRPGMDALPQAARWPK
jgi:hypothetical protein